MPRPTPLTAQQILSRLGGSTVLARLISEIDRVSQATDATGGKGSVTLTVKTSKEKHSQPGDQMIVYETGLTAKLPSQPPRVTHLYVSDRGGLFADPPDQEQFDGVRVVETSTAAVRNVDDGAQAVVREA